MGSGDDGISNWMLHPLIGEVKVSFFNAYLVIYGGQFSQHEEHIIPGSEPATFRKQLTSNKYTYHKYY